MRNMKVIIKYVTSIQDMLVESESLLHAPHPKMLVLCSSAPVCLMKKTLRTYKESAVLVYKQHGPIALWLMEQHLPQKENNP